MNFKKEIKFHPAWDKGKEYGIHGAELVFYLHGDKGVIQFVTYLNWMLPQNRNEISSNDKYPFQYWMKPQPADLGYHSYELKYDGQTLLTDKCSLLNNKPCYYDGSGLNAEPIFEILISEGEEGVWKKLEEYYMYTFEGEEWK